jgi:hypothetical protein
MTRPNALAAVLGVIAIAFAAGWALVLPIFLSPDEDSHYDYALTLYTAARPMRPAENVVGRDTQPVVAYLMSATHARQQRLDTAVGADPGYGGAAYFRALDAGAPHVDARAMHDGPIVPVPYISRLYPIGYYALAALAIGLGDRLTHGSAVAEVLFARFLSVALLVPTLLFTWLALRELALGTRKALAILACTALLPLTAWMAGYVQPDNLVCALVAPALYVALRLRRRPDDTVLLAALGLLLAALMATKQQYFLAVFIPIAAMLAARAPLRLSAATLRWPALLTLPPLLAFAATEPMLRDTPGGGGVCRSESHLAAGNALGIAHAASFLVHGIHTTITGSFLGTSGLDSFWLAYTAYRNTDLVLGNPTLTTAAIVAIAALTAVVAALFLARVVLIVPRLVAVGRTRGWRSVARIATSNVLVNAYLCYLAILCGFEMSIGGYIPVQGRYFLPFVSAVWLIAVVIAPRALPRRFGRAFGGVLLTLILSFDLVACAFTFPSLHDRFYVPSRAVPPQRELLADVSVGERAGLWDVRGAAVDLRDADPAQRVVVRLDDRIDLATRSVPRPDMLCNMEQTLLQTGFDATIPPSQLRAGRHEVAVFVKTPWSARLLDTGARTSFDVAVARPLLGSTGSVTARRER